MQLLEVSRSANLLKNSYTSFLNLGSFKLFSGDVQRCVPCACCSSYSYSCDSACHLQIRLAISCDLQEVDSNWMCDNRLINVFD